MDDAPRIEILDDNDQLYVEAEYWEGTPAPFIIGIARHPLSENPEAEYADLTQEQAAALAGFIREHTLEATA